MMPGQVTLDADLEFAVQLPGAQPVTGTIRGSGTNLELCVSDLSTFAGRSDSTTVGHLAGMLARSGLSVTVVASSGPLLTLGAPHPPWWQRRVTGSRHIRIERFAALWTLARGRASASAAGALPSSAMLPPGTLSPLAPTLMKGARDVTTTHDPRRGGNPRLVTAPGTGPGPDDAREVFPLSDVVTSIGSDASNDVRLPGLDPWHVEIHHDDRDEFVLRRVGRLGGTMVNGERLDVAMLRTGTRLEMGPWTMSFARDEYADHGRPYGGREGGEFGQNRPQPSRRSAQREGDA